MRKKSVMVTWLWNLIQGDFAQNPTAWMDLAITVLGIVLSPVAWFTSKCLEGKAAKREAKDAQEKFDAQLEVLKGQLKAANDSADALRAQVKTAEDSADALRGQLAAQRTQARLAEETASVPKWDIYQVQNLKYAVANENAFDAHDVRVVLSSGKEYELGNISKGSSIGFMFMEKAIMCEDGYADIRITWSLPGESGERHSVTKPSPQYLH